MNTPVLNEDKQIINSFSEDENELFSNFSQDEDIYSDLFGIGKKAKARKDERHTARMERKKSRTNLINAKAEGIKKGTFQPGGAISNALKSVTGAVSSVLGGTPSEENETNLMNNEKGVNEAPTDKKKNTLIWIVLVVLILVAVYFFVIRPKIKK